MRQQTVAPGAARATLASSSALSTAKTRTPCSYASAIQRSFLMVLPYEMRAGSAPAARHASISAGLAASNDAPRATSSSRIGGAGFAFTA
jgi:hypothetical protein